MSKDEKIAKLYMDGYTYVEIAELCNVSRHVVGISLRRSRDAGHDLRRIIDDLSVNTREKAIFERRCKQHLEDLYHHHGKLAA